MKFWLYMLVCRARYSLERANRYQLVPGVPPSPLYRLHGGGGDWDTAVMTELCGESGRG